MSSARPGPPVGEVPSEQIEAVGVLRFRLAKLCLLAVEPGSDGFDEATAAAAAAWRCSSSCSSEDEVEREAIVAKAVRLSTGD